ncbi:MAG: hypothetical protein C0594_08290, partial [Marinilabiliales bacterium]
MRKLIILMLIVVAYQAYAQFPSGVKEIKPKPNGVVSVKGNLSQGKVISDLTWAWSSSNACFPGTQKEKFTGNHVLYHSKLPRRAIMTITVIPDEKNANFSIYAYSIGTTNYSVVPNLSSCVSCEAEHKWDYPKSGKTQNHTRSISLNAINNPYNVVIGVVGANGLKTGGYTLKVEIEGGEEESHAAQAEVKPIAVVCEKNKTKEIKGNLKDGVIIQDLSWAWS